nr:MAG TPA: hypothetical protein [Caudoviricetes sp.]
MISHCVKKSPSNSFVVEYITSVMEVRSISMRYEDIVSSILKNIEVFEFY